MVKRAVISKVWMYDKHRWLDSWFYRTYRLYSVRHLGTFLCSNRNRYFVGCMYHYCVSIEPSNSMHCWRFEWGFGLDVLFLFRRRCLIFTIFLGLVYRLAATPYPVLLKLTSLLVLVSLCPSPLIILTFFSHMHSCCSTAASLPRHLCY